MFWIVPLIVLFSLRAADDPFWKDHIEPIFREHCGNCHSGVKTKGGLDLGTFQSILKGGEHGAVLIPGHPKSSVLIQVLAPGVDSHMPPKGQLSAEQIGLIETWIGRLAVSSAPTHSSTNLVTLTEKPKKPGWIPSPSLSAVQVIDGFIQRGWKVRKAAPSRPIDDSLFIRRLTLDLLGHLPTESEVTQLLKDRSPSRREKWVDRLLNDPAHARHLAEVFDVVLMGRRGQQFETQRRNNHWFAYMESAFKENRPWDRFLNELIVGRPGRTEDRGAVWFLSERNNNPQAMAEAVAPLVFGLQIKCAQCHDHMVAREIKQAHYWGMVAAFNRTKSIETEKGPALAESAIGGFVSFANLRKESQQARLLFFNGRSVDEDWPKDNEKEVDSPSLYEVPQPLGKERPRIAALPKFSRRAALAEAVTRDNPLLAKAMVNRIWALLLGRGLVHPVDLMDSKHPASHPELLDWLTKDFAASGYNVRRLIRSCVLSQAYGLDSRPVGKRAALPEAFATGPEKPLSAEQLYRSIMQVTGGATDGKEPTRSDDDELRRAFIRQFPDLFAPEYNASLQQALFLSNSPLFDRVLKPSGTNLTSRLSAMADLRSRAEAAVRSVYGRPAAADELAEAVRYLAKRPSETGTQQLLWALLTSPEFQTNH